MPSGQNQVRLFTRASPDPGADVASPFGSELKVCGGLPTYELAFEVTSDKLVGKDWPLLKSVADLLKEDSAIKIKILGHTDSTGDAEKNKDLSQGRAESVRKALVDKYGADATHISVKGWGAEQPLSTNDTEDGRALNRRVEIVVAR